MNLDKPSTQFRLSRIARSAVIMALLLLPLAGFHRSQAQTGMPQPVATEPAASYAEGRVVGASSLNLRTGPHISYTAVAYLMEGEQVRLVGRNRAATWFQIELYNGYRGWINARYVQPNSHITALPIAEVALLGITGFVTNDPIMVYAGPGSLHVPVGIARPGSVLTLSGRNDATTWVFAILPDGRAGWLPAGSPILPSSSLNDLPIISPFIDSPLYPAAAYLVYSGPGFLFEPFFRMTQGQRIEVRGRSGDARWVAVRLPDGREGWLAADILQLTVNLADVPVIDGIAPPQAVGWQASTPTRGPGKTLPTAGETVPTKQASPTPTPGQERATPTETITATATREATPTSAMPPTPTATGTTRPTGTPTATPAASGGVLVYAAPDATAAALATVTAGQSVAILGRTADSLWVKIRLADNREGWVRAGDVQINIDLSLLPIAAP